jgi:hypothetical protein
LYATRNKLVPWKCSQFSVSFFIYRYYNSNTPFFMDIYRVLQHIFSSSKNLCYSAFDAYIISWIFILSYPAALFILTVYYDFYQFLYSYGICILICCSTYESSFPCFIDHRSLKCLLQFDILMIFKWEQIYICK